MPITHHPPWISGHGETAPPDGIFRQIAGLPR